MHFIRDIRYYWSIFITSYEETISIFCWFISTSDHQNSILFSTSSNITDSMLVWSAINFEVCSVGPKWYFFDYVLSMI
jgi:hypothetical protein